MTCNSEFSNDESCMNCCKYQFCSYKKLQEDIISIKEQINFLYTSIIKITNANRNNMKRESYEKDNL